jgi:hypothetical protein
MCKQFAHFIQLSLVAKVLVCAHNKALPFALRNAKLGISSDTLLKKLNFFHLSE